MKEQFQARMLRIHFTEGDKWEGEALYKAIVAKCIELESRANSLPRPRGFWGERPHLPCAEPLHLEKCSHHGNGD